MFRTPKSGAKKDTGATVGYEAELWAMGDALRGGMDGRSTSTSCSGSEAHGA